jgi:hypothetical protein
MDGSIHRADFGAEHTARPPTESVEARPPSPAAREGFNDGGPAAPRSYAARCSCLKSGALCHAETQRRVSAFRRTSERTDEIQAVLFDVRLPLVLVPLKAQKVPFVATL